jgi:hypothetical protein
MPGRKQEEGVTTRADKVLATNRQIADVARRGLPVAIGICTIALVAGLLTARDYGISIDEFNANDYGPKALAWYTSGFHDKSSFETVEAPLWYYGPWFQILVAYVQSFSFADPLTVRHALTFACGLLGLAALIPLSYWTFGYWAGTAALMLCLSTGYLYGSLFFTPIDVPFLAAMSWAMAAIVAMARSVVPAWLPTLFAGIFSGLAIATRTGGIITHAYLAIAIVLCATEAYLIEGQFARRDLAAIALRSFVVIGIAWPLAIALWPWLQTGNPFAHFRMAFAHFAKTPVSFEFPHWGEDVRSDALPWTYIPGQLLARLPIPFLLLLGSAIVLAAKDTISFVILGLRHTRYGDGERWGSLLLRFARTRSILIVWAAALTPIVFLIAEHATLYDGVRHILFVIPMLALLAGGALVRLASTLSRSQAAAALAVVAAYTAGTVITFKQLHPLEYVAMNAIVGGAQGAYEKFDLDYWSIAGTEALRRLEHKVDLDSPGLFERNPPSIVVCIPNREHMALVTVRRPWRLEVDPAKPDFVIETERSRCAKPNYVLIDEVRRADRAFAWTWRKKSFPGG